MVNLIAFTAALALQAGAPAQAAPAQVTVLSECDASSEVAARVPKDAALEVHYSLAGVPTCYFVTLNARGETVRGYVVDRELDVVVAFEKSRVESEQAAFKAPPPASTAPVVTAEPAKTADPAAKAQEKKPVPKRKDVAM